MSKQKEIKKSHTGFTSRFGAVAATVGSAVGLGNIWRFPYEAGTHGGGAFLICYVVFVLLLGIPLLCAEFIIGREGKANIMESFRRLAPGKHWYLIGYLSVIASSLIIGFYTVVAGWTLEYMVQSAIGGFSASSREEFHDLFLSFSTGTWRPLLWTVLFLALNCLVMLRGVTKGIEKISNLMMPVLFLILVAFCVYAATMSGYRQGIEFFFLIDMSHFDAATILGALGQTFFSLSIGLGCIITYGSYLPANSRLGSTSVTTATLDSLVAFLASMVIFPAVFTFGFSPQAGPALIFEVLPSIFAQLPGGMILSFFFFLLLVIASLTSTISISEILIAVFEQNGMGRKKATILNTGIALVLAVLCTLSFGCLEPLKICGLTIFNLFDYVASNILLPLGGFFIAIFVGWVLPKETVRRQMLQGTSGRSLTMYHLVLYCLRFVAPVAIVLIFLNSIGLL